MPINMKTSVRDAIAAGHLSELDLDAEGVEIPEWVETGRSRISSGPLTRRAEIAGTLWRRFGVPSRQIHRPDSLQQLVAVVQEAVDRDRRIQVVGAARGLSLATDPVDPKMMCVSSEKLSKIYTTLNAPRDVQGLVYRSNANPNHLVRVQAGVPVRKALRELKKKNLAFATHGSGDFHGLVGALATGTHGSGARFPSMDGFIRALVVVRVRSTAGRPEVVVELIQRSENTPSSAPQAPVYARPNLHWLAEGIKVEPVFDDDIFFAHTVGVGMLGVVYSMTLEVVPMINLSEVRLPRMLTSVLADLPDLNRTARHVELVVDPYPRKVTPGSVEARSEVETGAPFDLTKVRCQLIVREQTSATPSGGRPITVDLGASTAAPGIIGGQIRALLRDPVEEAPKAGQSLISCTSIVDPPYVDELVEVLLLNLRFEGLGAEWAVPADRLEQALEVVLKLGWSTYNAFREDTSWRGDSAASLTSLIRLLSKHTPMYNGPAVRFVKGGNSLLAHSNRRGAGDAEVPLWATIEVGFLGPPGLMKRWLPRKRFAGIRPEEPISDTRAVGLLPRLPRRKAKPPHSKDWPARSCAAVTSSPTREILRLYAAYERGRQASLKAMERGLMPLGGRPHQGLYNTLTWTDVEACWGSAAATFRARYLEANPVGTFDGPLSEKWKIRSK